MINYYKIMKIIKICGASGRRFYFTVLLLLMQLIKYVSVPLLFQQFDSIRALMQFSSISTVFSIPSLLLLMEKS